MKGVFDVEPEELSVLIAEGTVVDPNGLLVLVMVEVGDAILTCASDPAQVIVGSVREGNSCLLRIDATGLALRCAGEDGASGTFKLVSAP